MEANKIQKKKKKKKKKEMRDPRFEKSSRPAAIY
jgi:hypothetical protein